MVRTMPPPVLAVVVPAYNEAAVVGRVVAGLVAVHPFVIVVDDCSSDATAALAAGAGAAVLRHAVNLGQGAALQTGISYALLAGADVIVTFDADGQHRVEDIAVLLDTQARTGADVVAGSRFLGSAVGMSPARRLMLRAAVRLTRLTSGVALTDAHNGLRLLTRHAAQRIQITQNRMSHASEIVHQVGTLGLRIVEAPVTVVYTTYSLAKGQRLSNSISILFEMLLARMSRQ